MGMMEDLVEKDTHTWDLEGGCPAGALFQCVDCDKAAVSRVEEPVDQSEAIKLPDLDGDNSICMGGHGQMDKME